MTGIEMLPPDIQNPEQDAPHSEDAIHSRHYARELVMKALYATAMNHGDFPYIRRQIIDSDERIDDENKQFAIALAKQTHDAEKECDTILKTAAKNWDVKRMAAIDLAILQIAITEFLYFPDIPPKVTINEAIDIAKRFSTEESGKFINGVLDAVLAQLTRDKTLLKRGRGKRTE